MDKTATTEFTQDEFAPVIIPETGATSEFSTASFQWVDSMTEYYYDGDKMISSRTYCFHKPDKNVWEVESVMDALTARAMITPDCVCDECCATSPDDAWQPAATVGAELEESRMYDPASVGAADPSGPSRSATAPAADLEYQTDCTIEQETTEEADDAWQPDATVGTCAACQVTPATDPTQPDADPTPSEDDDDDDVAYRITPKGCFALSLVHAGICEDVDAPDIDVAWEEFEQSMTINGYVHSDDEELEFLQ